MTSGQTRREVDVAEWARHIFEALAHVPMLLKVRVGCVHAKVDCGVCLRKGRHPCDDFAEAGTGRGCKMHRKLIRLDVMLALALKHPTSRGSRRRGGRRERGGGWRGGRGGKCCSLLSQFYIVYTDNISVAKRLLNSSQQKISI